MNTALDNTARTVQQSYVKHTENLKDGISGATSYIESQNLPLGKENP
jgi:hypothetical protein